MKQSTARLGFLVLLFTLIGASTFLFLRNRNITPSISLPAVQNQANVLGAFASNGLVLYWPMESATNPAQSGYVSSTDYTPTATAGTLVDGFQGKAIQFNGSTIIKTKRPVADDMTICMWFKTAKNGGGLEHYRTMSLFTSEWPNLATDFGMGVDSNGSLAFGAGNTTSDFTAHGNTIVSDGNWHYGCATRAKTSGLMQIYVDGSLQGSLSGVTDSLVANNNATLGEQDDTPHNPFVGIMDEVRVYNRVLSSQEISDLFLYRPTSAELAANTSNTTTSSASTPSTPAAPTQTPSNPVVVPTQPDTNTQQNIVIPATPTPLLTGSAGTPVGNGVVIRDTSGQTQTNRPITVPRYFARGDIPNFPQARINGNSTLTQADVKTRWDDGSAKFVLVSFLGTIPANDSIKVDFINQSSGNNTGQLTAQDMLSTAYDFNAVIDTQNSGNRITVSARDMIAAGKFTYWMKGPIVTQIIAEDRSSALSFDFGFKAVANTIIARPMQPTDTTFDVQNSSGIVAGDIVKFSDSQEQVRICNVSGNTLTIGTQAACPSLAGRGQNGTSASLAYWGSQVTVPAKAGQWAAETNPRFESLHPAFIVTFYSNSAYQKNNQIDYVVENDWMNKIQDQPYSVSLKAGYSNPTTLYAKATFNHIANTRWHKSLSANPLPPVFIDFNLPYMTQSGVIPNFDTSIVMSQSTYQQLLSDYGGADKDIMGSSLLLKRFEGVGGRNDIGLLTTWDVAFLYGMKDGYSRGQELMNLMLSIADAGNHVPIFLRDVSSKNYVSGSSEAAFGHMLSIDAHPTIYSPSDLWNSSDQNGDTVQTIGNYTSNGWGPDLQHQPNFAFISYLVTGNPYYLDEMYGWSSYNLASANPCKAGAATCRGADWGFMQSEFRGTAWAMRAVGEAAVMAPDSTVEKTYYTNKLNNNIAILEGMFNVRGDFYQPCTTNPFNAANEQSKWCWGSHACWWRKTKPAPLYSRLPRRCRSSVRRWRP